MPVLLGLMKICVTGLLLSLLPARGSAPLCPDDHLALRMETREFPWCQSVEGGNSRKSKDVALE